MVHVALVSLSSGAHSVSEVPIGGLAPLTDRSHENRSHRGLRARVDDESAVLVDLIVVPVEIAFCLRLCRCLLCSFVLHLAGLAGEKAGGKGRGEDESGTSADDYPDELGSREGPEGGRRCRGSCRAVSGRVL